MKKFQNILVTGGLGFIGSNLVNNLINNKITKKCIILDKFSTYINPLKSNYKDYRGARFNNLNKIIIERGDATDPMIVLKILEKYNPEIIFHTASIPLAKLDNLNSLENRQGSVDSTINILECLNHHKSKNKKYNLRRFVYFSSSMVYGDFKSKVAKETDELNPKEIYGTMKHAGEVITKGLSNFYNIPYTIIRPSAVYGPTDMNNRVSQIFINKAINGEKISIAGKDEKLDFTFVNDLVDGSIKAAISKKTAGEILNITNGKGETLFRFVQILRKYFKNLKYEIKSRDKFRPKRGTLSIKKISKLTGFRPKYSLEFGIKKYLDFLGIKKN